jgi:hypothetical protein
VSPAIEYAGVEHARLVRNQQLGRLEAVLHLQPLEGAADVGVHRVAGDAELATDLLGIKVLDDQPQALALPSAEQLQTAHPGVGAGIHLAEVNQTLSRGSSHRERSMVEHCSPNRGASVRKR